MYAALPQVAALAEMLDDSTVSTVRLDGLVASSASMVFASMALRTERTMFFILKDADEAGYFYHDLTQVMGLENVLYFPSSYRRAVKYGQRDAASEILRTEVLAEVKRRSQGSERRVGVLIAIRNKSHVARLIRHHHSPLCLPRFSLFPILRPLPNSLFHAAVWRAAHWSWLWTRLSMSRTL